MAKFEQKYSISMKDALYKGMIEKCYNRHYQKSFYYSEYDKNNGYDTAIEAYEQYLRDKVKAQFNRLKEGIKTNLVKVMSKENVYYINISNRRVDKVVSRKGYLEWVYGNVDNEMFDKDYISLHKISYSKDYLTLMNK